MNQCESYEVCSTFFLHLTFKENFSQGQILLICSHSRNLNILNINTYTSFKVKNTDYLRFRLQKELNF